MFVSLYQAGLDTTSVTGPEADLLVERARAGFQAGRSERRAVYRKLGAVVDAALGLHEFLLANEDRIQYDPALGSSRDPALEAVPDTPELGNDMWDRVDGITASLDALGALDRVTTERLLALLFSQLDVVRIR